MSQCLMGLRLKGGSFLILKKKKNCRKVGEDLVHSRKVVLGGSSAWGHVGGQSWIQMLEE